MNAKVITPPRHMTQENSSKALVKDQDETSAILQVIERAASNPSVDIDKMERLLQMQERVMDRNAKMAFNASFAQMQTEMPVITERGEIAVGGQVRSKYAKFEDINEAVKPILERHGFSINFKTMTEGKDIAVTGVLMHSMGHREEASMVLPSDTSGSKNNVQALGSSISYGKRYVMNSLLNITSRGEDNNGQGAKISEEQVATIEALMEETKADRPKFLKYMAVEKVSDISEAHFKNAIAALERKRNQS
jgi:ERF superfamily.